MKERYFTVAKTITKWKHDNWFENWLGEKADTSEFWKNLYVLYYLLIDSSYYKKGLPYIQAEIVRQMPNVDGLAGVNLRRDMVYSLHRFGASFEEYFLYNFYNLNVHGRQKYNNLKMQYGYCELVNKTEIRHLFENKGECYRLFRDFYRRDLVEVTCLDDHLRFKEFVAKHPSFIYKPLNGHSGIGIKIFRDIRLEDEEAVDDIFTLGDGCFVAEELIEQAEGMAVLHKQSINTIRISTFSLRGEVTLLGAALRMGTGNSMVNNAGAGGIYASVDIKEGIVNSIARDNVCNQ